MKFSSKEDIEAPIEQVFSMLSEFETFERSAIRRGAEVQRTDDLTRTGRGMSWHARFMMRGKQRNVNVTLTNYDPPNAMLFETDSPGLDGQMMIDLLALSPRRTRLSVAFEMTPKTLPARLLIQSLKLAKTNLTKRFKLRVADYAKDIEDRARRSA